MGARDLMEVKSTGEALTRRVVVVTGTVAGINAAGVHILGVIDKATYNTGRLRQVRINAAYVGGVNGSFKAQAGGGRRLSLIVNHRETGGGAYRRSSPDIGDFRIRTTDTHDILSAPACCPIPFSEDMQIQVDLNNAPANPFDLQWWAEIDVDV